MNSEIALLQAAPKLLFEAIAVAHDFSLKKMTLAEANRLEGFLEVAEQKDYPVCVNWPEKIFLSAKLGCKIELQRAMLSQQSVN